MSKFYTRWAPSLGDLDATHQEVWETGKYKYPENKDDPCVFFGLYDMRDYIALWRHTGKKYILWAGSDLRNLTNEFLFNDGKLKWLSRICGGIPKAFRNFLKDDCEHWVENEIEAQALYKALGIHPSICPSFLGLIGQYNESYGYSREPNVYVSASEGRQEEYGFRVVAKIADKLPFIKFHLYGALWQSYRDNIFVHGRVTKEQMNREIKDMQCGLRLNEFDGFSEITAKSILMAQYPICRIKYPHVGYYENEDQLIELLKDLRNKYAPNYAGRNYYLTHLNQYPWYSNPKNNI